MSILFEFLFPISSGNVVPAQDLSYLHNLICVGKMPVGQVDPEIHLITDNTQISTYTTSADFENIIGKGLNKFYLISIDDLSKLKNILNENLDKGFCIYLSKDYTTLEKSSIDLGKYNGVVGAEFSVELEAKAFAVNKGFVGYYAKSNLGENLQMAFSHLLSRNIFKNCQVMQFSKTNGIDTLGEAEVCFDDRVSFAIDDQNVGTRLSGFFAGGLAIIEPFVIEYLKNKLQSAFVKRLGAVEPNYTMYDCKLMESYLQKKVLDPMIKSNQNPDGYFEYATINITLENDNFVASANISVSEPNAWWRILGTIIEGAE